MEVGGVLFFAAFSYGNDFSGNDGVGKLFWSIKKLEFLLLLDGD